MARFGKNRSGPLVDAAGSTRCRFEPDAGWLRNVGSADVSRTTDPPIVDAIHNAGPTETNLIATDGKLYNSPQATRYSA